MHDYIHLLSICIDSFSTLNKSCDAYLSIDRNLELGLVERDLVDLCILGVLPSEVRSKSSDFEVEEKRVVCCYYEDWHRLHSHESMFVDLP